MNNSHDPLAPHDSLAFEWVTGSLRGDERKAAAQKLKNDPAFAQSVQFWEEHLMSLQANQSLPPKPQTWQIIARSLERDNVSHSPTRWSWWLGFGLATSLLVTSWLGLRLSQQSDLNADYVAVLVSDSASAQLTALTTIDGKTIWLNWENVVIPDGQSLQLWAVSRRDNEARSLAVFEQSTVSQLDLNETSARLIADAAELWLTLEERGGSAIDAPSDVVIAKGICVRLKRS